MRTHWWMRIGALLLLSLIVSYLDLHAHAQQVNLADAIKAVVRIRGCNVGGCNVGLGSGVVIHSSGVILTANHVTLTDPRNPLSPRLEDFVIEITENARQAPQARYRARLLAAKPEADLALLGIYWDEVANQALDDPAAVNLPALAIADVSTIGLGDRLHILGYPLAGGAAINYTEAALGGFDENGALLKVNASLNEGYSGGPVLVEQDGRFTIVGVVILRRADVSFFRSIDRLGGLIWENTARRVWFDNVQVKVLGGEADSTLQLNADIHALDYVNHKGRLLAYMFNAVTQQPWPAGTSDLAHSENGQVVLNQDFTVMQPVATLPQAKLKLLLNQTNIQPTQVMFRLVLWDKDEMYVLWQDNYWYHPRASDVEVAVGVRSTPTPVNLPRLTITPPPIKLRSPTNTPSPLPTSTRKSTQIPTATPPLSELEFRFTAAAEAIMTAAEQTIEAVLSATPSPTSPETAAEKAARQEAEQTVEAAFIGGSSLPTATVNIAELNLRTGSGINYLVIKSYSQGTVVSILGKDAKEQWLQVKTPDGQTGWMAIPYLLLASELSEIPVVEP